MNVSPDWSGASGDAWAMRWQETDRALRPLAEVLDAAILAAAPPGPFRALDIGCGPGSTSLALAAARPDSTIVGCDLSPALVELAAKRAHGLPNVRFHVGDAQSIAAAERPFDLFLSRHGVMFFEDPRQAFATFRAAATVQGRLVFSCFQDWQANPWASELAMAAAGKRVPAPGREPSGFAFAEVDYVAEIVASAGWAELEHRPVNFGYVAGEGPGASEEALAFLSEVGPASRLMRGCDDGDRPAASARMRQLIERYRKEERVEFPAAAWLWSAKATANSGWRD
jgi:ubiquinone/menaquinone biosynthesis C-methylase UbiE